MLDYSKLIIAINNNSLAKVIFANQGTPEPPLPFSTLQILNSDEKKMRSKIEKLENGDYEKKFYNEVEEVIQFSSYAENTQKAYEEILKIVDFFKIIFREENWEEGINLVNISEISNRTYLHDEIEYNYVYSVDVTLSYEREVIKKIINMEKVEIEGEIVERK